MDGGGGEGVGEEGWRRLQGEVDDDVNDNDEDDDGPSPQTGCRRLLADVRRDNGTIGGLLEAHHHK